MNELIIVQAIASGALAVATVFLYFANRDIAKSTRDYLEETAKMREVMDKELKMKNKPVVGVDTIRHIFGVEDTGKIGKHTSWNPEKQKFYCELEPIDVKGVQFYINLKNFTSEPATKVHLDTELWVGKTQMPKTVDQEEDKIIMPSQTVTNSATITKEPLLEALKNKNEIVLKIKIKYSDLSEIEDIFEYYMEANFDGNSIINKKSYFKDRRQ